MQPLAFGKLKIDITYNIKILNCHLDVRFANQCWHRQEMVVQLSSDDANIVGETYVETTINNVGGVCNMNC